MELQLPLAWVHLHYTGDSLKCGSYNPDHHKEINSDFFFSSGLGCVGGCLTAQRVNHN